MGNRRRELARRYRRAEMGSHLALQLVGRRIVPHVDTEALHPDGYKVRLRALEDGFTIAADPLRDAGNECYVAGELDGGELVYVTLDGWLGAFCECSPNLH